MAEEKEEEEEEEASRDRDFLSHGPAIKEGTSRDSDLAVGEWKREGGETPLSTKR